MGVVDSIRAALRGLGLTAEEDEFDPFAGESLDSPPSPEQEGDDRVHEDDGDA